MRRRHGAYFLLAALGFCLSACGSRVHTGAKLPKGRAATAAAASNVVAVSPSPGTPDASPRTRIGFLGRKGTKVLFVHAVGSRTGYHSGKLEARATGTGASFLPKHRFAPGETVAVNARVKVEGREASVGTSFRVQSAARSARAAKRSAPPAKRSANQRSGRSPNIAGKEGSP